VASIDEALSVAAGLGKKDFVAGGGSIYALALPIADEMYLSTIKGELEGDTFFPEFDAREWKVVEERDHPEFVLSQVPASSTWPPGRASGAPPPAPCPVERQSISSGTTLPSPFLLPPGRHATERTNPATQPLAAPGSAL